jgi:hypothetical protein
MIDTRGLAMRVSLGAFALAACCLALGAGGGVPVTRADDGEKGPAKSCWSSSDSAPYRGFGYDHVVTITNRCDKPLDCDVRTKVNPDPTHARVAGHATVEVITFHGSPAREFKSDVQCKPAG